MPARAHLSRDALVGGLQTLVRLQGRRKKNIGRAHWRFEADGLTILWGEFEQVIGGSVTEPGIGSIESDVMRSLAVRLPHDDVLEVQADGLRVKLGSLLIDSMGVLDKGVLTPGPDAPDAELLKIAIRFTREELRAAGLETRVDQAVARFRHATAEAAGVLAPFGIAELTLSRFLSDTIRAQSTTRGPRPGD